jgi:hypothetical protein
MILTEWGIGQLPWLPSSTVYIHASHVKLGTAALIHLGPYIIDMFW